uniref:Globin family profile domain-containing protein n=1 Tax=Plectus sambesii TaxID=2011161 RepID=A0A914UKD7_9BILA
MQAKNDRCTPKNSNSSMLKQTSRLSPKQRAILTETFRKMEDDGKRTGVNIFVRLFAEYPNYKAIWPQFQAIPDSSLMGAQELQKHAGVYMSGLRNIIASIDDNEALAEQLKKIALTHLKWGIRTFHIQNMLPEVLATVHLCMNGITPEVKDAWTTLFAVIASMVEDFRLDAEQKQNYRKGQGGLAGPAVK